MPCLKYLLPLLILLCLSSPGKADERGDMTLGLGGGYASANESGFTTIYFRYTLGPHIRIDNSVGYVFPHKSMSSFALNIDAQTPFSIVRGVQVFPLAGVSVANWNLPDDNSSTRAGFNLGGGFDLKLTSTLRLSVAAKYTWIKHTSGVFVGAGLGYNF